MVYVHSTLTNNVQAPVELSNYMFMAIFVIATGGLKALYGAWFLRVTDPIFKMRATQRMRYTLLGLGSFISFAPMAYLMHKYGQADFWLAVKEWRGINTDSVFRWVVTLCLYIGITTPIWAALSTVYIYRRPALAGRKYRGGYQLTSDIRSKEMQLRTYSNDQLRTLERQALITGWYGRSHRKSKQFGFALSGFGR